jgi:Heparan-alpha-glucosaminide N-acetyltransferase, catalytic
MPDARAPVRTRREYLDWLHGVAVLLMIEAHLIGSWTSQPDRGTTIFGYAVIVGGMGSVFFLVLAGTAAALSAGSKWRGSGDAAAAASSVVRHGLLIFALAFVFRLQAWILGGLPNPRDLLKVDILNVMGPAVVFTGLLWRSARTVRSRCVVFAIATALTSFLTPLLRVAPLGFLPDPIKAYLVPQGSPDRALSGPKGSQLPWRNRGLSVRVGRRHASRWPQDHVIGRPHAAVLEPDTSVRLGRCEYAVTCREGDR